MFIEHTLNNITFHASPSYEKSQIPFFKNKFKLIILLIKSIPYMEMLDQDEMNFLKKSRFCTLNILHNKS